MPKNSFDAKASWSTAFEKSQHVKAKDDGQENQETKDNISYFGFQEEVINQWHACIKQCRPYGSINILRLDPWVITFHVWNGIGNKSFELSIEVVVHVILLDYVLQLLADVILVANFFKEGAVIDGQDWAIYDLDAGGSWTWLIGVQEDTKGLAAYSIYSRRKQVFFTVAVALFRH